MPCLTLVHKVHLSSRFRAISPVMGTQGKRRFAASYREITFNRGDSDCRTAMWVWTALKLLAVVFFIQYRCGNRVTCLDQIKNLRCSGSRRCEFLSPGHHLKMSYIYSGALGAYCRRVCSRKEYSIGSYPRQQSR